MNIQRGSICLSLCLLIGVFLNFPIHTLAQDRPAKLSRVEKRAKKDSIAVAMLLNHNDSYDSCVFTAKYTARQRRHLYPFNKTAKVLAISYNPPVMEITSGDSVLQSLLDNSGLTIKNGKLNYSLLKEIKELDDFQIDNLTDLLFNTDYNKKELNSISEGRCFEPRNAFVFFNSGGRVFDYFEICFECQNSISGSGKISPGVLCTQKYELLRSYFIGLGIKHGTDKN